MLDLLLLCEQAGTPVGFYDKLVSLIKKKTKDGVNMATLRGRDSFLSSLRTKIKTPRPYVSTSIPGHKIVKFSFQEQLQDLLASSRFDDLTNLCANEDRSSRFSQYIPTAADEVCEILGSRWYSLTCEKMTSRNHENVIVLPLVLYADKTGKDAFQRYPLEPWMFPLANLRLECREDSGAWRHLGFLPPLSEYGSAEEGCQLYHDCLRDLLSGILDCQRDPPSLMVNLGGKIELRRVLTPISIITGDQLSQDNVCGRRPVNSGGCGRIHRSCMCSQIASLSSEGTHPCRPPNTEIIRNLQKIALMNEKDSQTNNNKRFE